MADQKRRLAAILSADVVGYSRLMGDDEEATIAVLVDRREVFSERVEDHDGRVVDTAGDSGLPAGERGMVRLGQLPVGSLGPRDRVDSPIQESARPNGRALRKQLFAVGSAGDRGAVRPATSGTYHGGERASIGEGEGEGGE